MMTTSTAAEDTAPVKLLVWDMGHVFVRFTWSEVCRLFCERANLDSSAFKSVLTHVGSLGYEAGKVTTEEFLNELNRQLATDLSEEEFTAIWNHGFEEDEEMATLLQELQSRYAMCLLSNTNPNHHRFLQDNYNVERHFHDHVLSYQVGYTKPDKRIYELVLSRNSVAASECLFIDDLEANVEAARAVGMRAIRFTDINALREELARHGVKS